MIKEENFVGTQNLYKKTKQRIWRYAPLLAWMIFIFIASTGQMSASNTSRFIRPLVLWIYPNITEENLKFVHFMVRKASHFTEYAVLALFAARAFIGSSITFLRGRWFLSSLLLVIIYALSDEFHQSFVSTRTGTVYDSMIDTAGGLTALFVFYLWRERKKKTFKEGEFVR